MEDTPKESLVALKTCPGCKIERSPDSFHKNKSKPDGLAVYCKSCKREIAARHFQVNKVKIAAQKKQYYKINKAEIAEQHKQYNQTNKAKISKQKKQYHQINKVKIAEKNRRYFKQYGKANRGKKNNTKIREGEPTPPSSSQAI